MSAPSDPLSPTALFDLTGLKAVVIGGTGVLGKVFSLTLAAAGAHVTVMGRSRSDGENVVGQIVARGGNALFKGIDIRSTSSVTEAADQGAATGGVDILVNAFGINDSTSFDQITPHSWQRVIDVNLTAVFYVCQAFKNAMSSPDRSSSIINISSASSGPPLTRVLAYGVSKAGVNNLTQYLAEELAPSNIRVNALIPGFFPAEQNRALLTVERIQQIAEHTPLRRLGEPEELAGALLWLASPLASSYVTGALIRVDGGFSAKTI